jgi:hypothetical protein
MKPFPLCRLNCLVGLSLTLLAGTARAADFRYEYVSLDNLPMPDGFAGFNFFFTSINEDDRVYGNVCNDVGLCYAALYERGAVAIIQPKHSRSTPFALSAVGHREVFGGSVAILDDPSQIQAAILHDGQLEPIPSQNGSTFAFVLSFTDLGALVDSIDGDNIHETFFFYDKGRIALLDFGQEVSPLFVQANRKGIVSGTSGSQFTDARAFRFDAHTGKRTQLDPLPTESTSWGVGVNHRGDVLGYSFIAGQTERIGVWDREGRFQTYFVEGTPAFPTISNWLVFNDNDVIAITQTSDGNSYIVPAPNQRLNLQDLTENLPADPHPFYRIQGIDNRSSMIGYGSTGSQFLLRRIGDEAHCDENSHDDVR